MIEFEFATLNEWRQFAGGLLVLMFVLLIVGWAIADWLKGGQ